MMLAGLLRIPQEEVTHMHCPDPDNCFADYGAKPCWSADGSSFCVPNLYELKILDFTRKKTSPCSVQGIATLLALARFLHERLRKYMLASTRTPKLGGKGLADKIFAINPHLSIIWDCR